jgi:hypothetical protein
MIEDPEFSSTQRAFNCQPTVLENVGVDQGGFDIFVAEQFLDGLVVL